MTARSPGTRAPSSFDGPRNDGARGDAARGDGGWPSSGRSSQSQAPSGIDTLGGEGDEVAVGGVVAHIRYESGDGDFQVVHLSAECGLVPAVVRGAALRLNERVEVKGRLRRTRRGELQVEVTGLERILPKTVEGIESYLASGSVPGIGAKIASEIVRVFGEKTLDVLDEAPERLREVPGVGKKRQAQIAEAWGEHRAVREIMVFLQSHGLSPAFSGRIFRQYGQRAVRIILEDPYRLAREVHGVGFRTADRIARSTGVAADDPRRIEAGVGYALDQAQVAGHVHLPRVALVAEAAAVLSVEAEAVEAAMRSLVARGAVAVDGEIDHDDSCWHARRPYDVECALTAALAARVQGALGARRTDDDALGEIERSLPFELAPGQRAALRTVAGAAVAVLTGGPGTGKTTIVRGVVALAQRAGARVELAAPTGRAAKRLSEATACEARTLHRLLAFDPRTGEFGRNEDDPIQSDLVIVDEASMLDQELALALVLGLGPGTALLLVGDVEQLPSVGAGDVLADIIDADVVSVARLDRVFRQVGESQILACAHAIRHGAMPEPAAGSEGEFFFIESPDPAQAVATVARLVTERMPRAFGLNGVDDIQVLTPMHGGPLGTQALNGALQQALGIGGAALTRGDRRLHVGDKVLQTRNNYDLEVFNGDIGRVVRIDLEAVTATVAFDGRWVTYDREALDDLTLAYAVTVHKSQGSEFRGVVLVLTTHHFRLLQRNLVYTAVTRARERLVIVGTRRALRLAIEGVSEQRRHTRLAARLREAAGAAG